MIKDVKKLSDVEKTVYFSRGQLFAMMQIYEDKECYDKYKLNKDDNLFSPKYKNMQFLEILERLGYPMDEPGTYLYKILISEVYNEIRDDYSHRSFASLEALKDRHSSFYHYVTNEWLEMPVETFVKNIEDTLDKVDHEKEDKELLDEILNKKSDVDFGEFAFALANLVKEKNRAEDEEVKKGPKLIKQIENE